MVSSAPGVISHLLFSWLQLAYTVDKHCFVTITDAPPLALEVILLEHWFSEIDKLISLKLTSSKKDLTVERV